MTTCPVLPPRISALLPELRTLVGGLSIRDRLPQIELAIGELDDGRSNEVLVLRNLVDPSPADEAALIEFAAGRGIEFYLQPSGPTSVRPLHPSCSRVALCAAGFRRRF